MVENRISAVMPQEDLDAILSAVNQIKAKMPFLVNLSLEDRKKMAKPGDRSRGFITRALEVATQNPHILPGVFNLEEMRKDVELHQKLLQIQMSLKQLLELVDNTTTVTQIDSYAAARAIYSYTKSCGKVMALQEAVNDLGKRFSRKASASAKNDSPVNPTNSPA